MADWRRLTIADLCSEAGGGIQTGPFGSQLHASDYVVDGTPSVMPQNIGNNQILPDGIARVGDEDMARLKRYWLRDGDIVYSRRGDVERRALVRAENDGWLCGTGCLRIRVGDQGVHDSRFVAYALGLESSRRWIVRHAVGATMLNLNTEILGRAPILVPAVSEQRAIAEVLEALDAKIAGNDKVLRVSDQLVRAAFDSCGVDATEKVSLSTIAENVRVQVDPAEIDPSVPYVGLEHVPRRSMWLPGAGVAGSVSSTKTRFRTGDVLFGKLRPYFHKVVRADRDGIASTDILVVRAKDSMLAGFVLAAASSDVAIRATSATVEGTRMPRTKWADLAAVTIPWPGEATAFNFSTQVSVLSDQAAARQRESRVVASTRDELLPLLMSGRLRVRDAEKTVEEVL